MVSTLIWDDLGGNKPLGSMGRTVYLPTNLASFYASCRYIFLLHYITYTSKLWKFVGFSWKPRVLPVIHRKTPRVCFSDSSGVGSIYGIYYLPDDLEGDSSRTEA